MSEHNDDEIQLNKIVPISTVIQIPYLNKTNVKICVKTDVNK